MTRVGALATMVVAWCMASSACHRGASPSAGLPLPTGPTSWESSAASAPERSAPAIWGALRPGPHAVGFRQLFVEDPSRHYRLHTEEQAHPRPVVAGIWYPAAPDTGTPMRLGDLLAVRSPRPDLDDFATVATWHLRGVMIEDVLHRAPELLDASGRATLKRVLNAPDLARYDATIATSQAPVLLAHTGLGGAFADNVVLYEYLASRGWVVVAGLFPQATGNWMHVDWDPATSILDLEILRSEGPASLGIGPTATAVIGHSYGAQAALVYAAVSDRVEAVVSLDSTIENADPDDPAAAWWRQQPHAAWLDRAGEVDVPALVLSTPGPARGFFDGMAGPRQLVTVPGVDHNDFESFAGAVRPAFACGPQSCDDRHRRYQAVVAITAQFLEEAVRGEPSNEHPQAQPEALRALGIERERVTAPTEAPAAAPALPPIEPAPDCRDDGSCDPVLLAVTHGYELMSLGRAAEALTLIDRALLAQPDAWILYDTRGRLLASQGSYADAARAFTTAAELMTEDDPMRARAEARREQAQALAEDDTP